MLHHFILGHISLSYYGASGKKQKIEQQPFTSTRDKKNSDEEVRLFDTSCP